MTIEAVVIFGIGGLVFWRVLVWLTEAARTPDPWGPEIGKAIEDPGTMPVCPHCLAPQEHNGWFCPECGSAVGQYSNYLPSVYIFSMGEAVRAGVQQRQPWTLLVAMGYVLIALAQFSLLAPLYCLFLFLHRGRVGGVEQPAEPNESGP